MPGIDGNVALRAMGKVREQIAGHDFNASLAFADVEKTSEMLYHSGRRCIDFLYALARFDYQRVLRLIPKIVQGSKDNGRLRDAMIHGGRTRDIADTWLAAQYGWSPLISDFVSAIEAWQVRKLKPRRVKFRGRASGVDRFLDLSAPGSLQRCNMLVREDISYVVTLQETGSTPDFTLLGMNLETMWSIAWERVPFSFVVDWFIPIGNAIQEWAFFRGMDYLYCMSTLQQFRGVVVAGTGVYPTFVDASGAFKPGVTPGRVSIRGAKFSREVGNALGWRGPSFKTLGRALSNRHLQNLSALCVALGTDYKSGKLLARPF